MRYKLSYVIGIFIVIAGILTGCGSLPEKQKVPEISGQGNVGAKEEVPSETPKADIDKREESSSETPKVDIDKEESPSETPKVDIDKREESSSEISKEEDAGSQAVREDGEYTSKEEVAAYLYEYGKLPGNYITKKAAMELGWVSNKGNLGEVAPGKSIGGDYFGNYEEILPKQSGRKYYECDIDTDGGYRGAKRIVYSSDGLIYYTEDHYTTFELLYTKDGKAEGGSKKEE